MQNPALREYLPFWDALTPAEQRHLDVAAVSRSFEKGARLHNGDADCNGLFLVTSGLLRVFLTSDSGREITLYRLLERDIWIGKRRARRQLTVCVRTLRQRHYAVFRLIGLMIQGFDTPSYFPGRFALHQSMPPTCFVCRKRLPDLYPGAFRVIILFPFAVYLVRKRCSMTAACARVAWPRGSSVVLLVPVM